MDLQVRHLNWLSPESLPFQCSCTALSSEMSTGSLAPQSPLAPVTPIPARYRWTAVDAQIWSGSGLAGTSTPMNPSSFRCKSPPLISDTEESASQVAPVSAVPAAAVVDRRRRVLLAADGAFA